MRTVTTRTPSTSSIDLDAIPSHESDAMCRTLICTIERLFQNPAIQADYDRWKRERESRPHK